MTFPDGTPKPSRPRHLPRMVAFAIAATLLPCVPAGADLILAVESVSVTPFSQLDSIDVTLTNTGPSAVTTSRFSFGLQASDNNVSFTDVTNNPTTEPYIFAGSSSPPGTVITTSNGSNLTMITAADVSTLGGGVTLAAGTEVGIGRVFFNHGQTLGVTTVSILAADTSFGFPTGGTIPITTLTPGTITVVSSAAVPEPSSMLLMPLGGFLLLLVNRRCRAAA